MELELSDVHRDIRMSAATFAVAELAPRVDHLERAPLADVDARLGELGLMGLLVAEDRGGIGLDPLAFVLVVEELAAVSPSVAWRLAMHAGPGAMALASTGAPLEGIADGSCRVSTRCGAFGVWPADWIVDPSGVYEPSSVRAEVVSTHGLTGSGLHRLAWFGEPRFPPPKDTQRYIDLSAAALMLGAARGALDAATRYAKERKQFDTPLASFQAIQWKIANAATGLTAARWLTWQAAGRLEAAPKARLLAGREALSATSDALQIHGGYGYTREYPVERMLRAVRMLARADEARLELAAQGI